MKIIRTDCELECPLIDRTLRQAGHELVLLPDGIGEARFAEEARDADLILVVEDGRIVARGRIMEGTFAAFERVLATLPENFDKPVAEVEISSPGGSVSDAMAIALAISGTVNPWARNCRARTGCALVVPFCRP